MKVHEPRARRSSVSASDATGDRGCIGIREATGAERNVYRIVSNGRTTDWILSGLNQYLEVSLRKKKISLSLPYMLDEQRYCNAKSGNSIHT